MRHPRRRKEGRRCRGRSARAWRNGRTFSPGCRRRGCPSARLAGAPTITPPQREAAVLATRAEHPAWGGRPRRMATGRSRLVRAWSPASTSTIRRRGPVALRAPVTPVPGLHTKEGSRRNLTFVCSVPRFIANARNDNFLPCAHESGSRFHNQRGDGVDLPNHGHIIAQRRRARTASCGVGDVEEQ
jgi:hypothetical protein